MERIILGLLIISVFIFVFVMEKVMPQVSAMIFLLSIIGIYGVLLTAGMLHQKRKARKHPKVPDTSYQPSVSVIIPAHNEAAVIEKSVERLMRLNYPHYEVLVVDDRSTDKTAEILERMACQYPADRFRWCRRDKDAFPGKSAVLNDALEKTAGEIICVFDADAVVDPGFLAEMMPFLAEDSEDKKIGAVQARKVIANADQNWLTLCQNYEYSMDCHFQAGRDSIRGAVELRGNGQLIKRAALREVGGWNEQTVTDDLDLSSRLHVAGWDIRFAHKILVYEEGISTFAPLLRQRRRWAEGSLLRYLHYSGQILMSDQTSLRTKVDMVAYIIEFLIPLILLADYSVMVLNYFLSDTVTPRVHLITTITTLPLLSAFFTITLVAALIRFNKLKVLPAIGGAILTATYMPLLWIPVVFGVVMRILFRPNYGLDWGKTEHFGSSS